MGKMRSLFGLIIAVALLAGQGSPAQMPRTSPIENPDYVCADNGGAFFFNIKTKNVWQGDRGDTEGIELKVTRVRNLNCANCYSIQAELRMFDQKLNYNFTISQKAKGEIKLVATIDDGEETALLTYLCQQ